MNFNDICNTNMCDKGDFLPHGNGYAEFYDLWFNKTTQCKINNNTIKLLLQRPFSSVWINELNINYINENVNFVSIFDKTNHHLPYSKSFNCENNYLIRSIASIIFKK